MVFGTLPLVEPAKTGFLSAAKSLCDRDLVADESDHLDDSEIVWRKKIFFIDLHEQVFADREFG